MNKQSLAYLVLRTSIPADHFCERSPIRHCGLFMSLVGPPWYPSSKQAAPHNTKLNMPRFVAGHSLRAAPGLLANFGPATFGLVVGILNGRDVLVPLLAWQGWPDRKCHQTGKSVRSRWTSSFCLLATIRTNCIHCSLPPNISCWLT